jgi:rod shape-determining protein MreD
MARHPRTRIGRTPSPFRRQAVPIATVVLGSMATLLPAISTAPVLPPLGLILFLAWRGLHRNLWLPWMGLPLGFVDDLFSGATIGTAMVLWTAILLGLDMLDRRFVWRDARQEWAIGSLLIATYLLIAYTIGGGAHSLYGPLLLLPQMVMAMLLFPLAMRVCDRLDTWRLRL